MHYPTSHLTHAELIRQIESDCNATEREQDIASRLNALQDELDDASTSLLFTGQFAFMPAMPDTAAGDEEVAVAQAA